MFIEKDKLIIQWLKHRNTPLLLVEKKGSFCDLLLLDYAKALVCEQQSLFCNNCLMCHKIVQKQYFDWYEINTYANGNYKKNWLAFFDQAYCNGIEGKKIFIIWGCENCNKTQANLILKTIEEKHNNNHFIFITRNLNQVLSTLKSRCYLYALPADVLGFEQIVEQKYGNLHLTPFFLALFFNLSEIQAFVNTQTFNHLVSVSKNIIASKHQYRFWLQNCNVFQQLSYSDIQKIFVLTSYYYYQTTTLPSYVQTYLKTNMNKTLLFELLTSFLWNQPSVL